MGKDMKNDLGLRLCPFCGKIPNVSFFEARGGVWLVYIICKTKQCPGKPETNNTFVGKSKQVSLEKIRECMQFVVNKWNAEQFQYDIKEIPEDIVKDFKSVIDGDRKLKQSS